MTSLSYGRLARTQKKGAGSGAALDLNGDDIHAVELLVSNCVGVVVQQSKGEIFGCGNGGLIGQERQLVLNILLSGCGDKLQLKHRTFRLSDDYQAGAIRIFVLVLLRQQAEEGFFARRLQSQRGGFVPSNPGRQLGEECIDSREGVRTQSDLQARAAGAHCFQQEGHADGNHRADGDAVAEERAKFIAKEVLGDGVTVEAQAQGAGKGDHQNALAVDAVAQDGLNAARKEDAHGEHEVRAQDRPGDGEQEGGELSEESQHQGDDGHADADSTGSDTGEVDQREAV